MACKLLGLSHPDRRDETRCEMRTHWHDGNQVKLLVNGEQFYPRVLAAIEAAERRVLLETFILLEDMVGQRLRRALIDAAGRGVRVDVTVDGFGSLDLSREFVRGLTAAGVRLHVYGPGRRVLGMRLNLFRRLHRKLVCVDRRVAFVGGMNFSADHLERLGEFSKQDYAVELQGPVVDDIHRFMESHVSRRFITRVRDLRVDDYPESVEPETCRLAGEAALADPDDEPGLRPDADNGVAAHSDDARVAFVSRDNWRHRTGIEREYRRALSAARERVIIANAYFFPGYRFVRALRRTARRGVEVHLLLQGCPDEPGVTYAARLLYRYLAEAGVRICEYRPRALHGKVAVVDDEWLTVGSSNLDPISLALNLEANVIIRDRRLAVALREHLEGLMSEHCRQVETDHLSRPTILRGLRSALVFHLLRRFPSWMGLLPGREPHIARVRPPGGRLGEEPEALG